MLFQSCLWENVNYSPYRCRKDRPSVYSDSQPRVWLKLTPLNAHLMPLKSQSKVRRPCRQASQSFMSQLSLFFPSFYAFIKQTNKSPEQKLMTMIDCAQCYYNACVIPCFINNWSETTGNFGFEVDKEELRWTLQMKEYVRQGKIGLLSSCEHMGEYF